MKVLRVPNQGCETLRDFYGGRAADPDNRSAEIGQRMLAFLDRLAASEGPQLWGMTSHLALHLFADVGGSVSVCVHGHGPGYVVESSKENAGSAWAAYADEAVALALIALAQSDGSVPRDYQDERGT